MVQSRPVPPFGALPGTSPHSPFADPPHSTFEVQLLCLPFPLAFLCVSEFPATVNWLIKNDSEQTSAFFNLPPSEQTSKLRMWVALLMFLELFYRQAKPPKNRLKETP